MTSAHVPLAAFGALYAEPAGSPIRALFPYLSRPGMISLAGGYPSASLFDAEGLALAAAQAMASGADALQYGATEGASPLREALAQQARDRGMRAQGADVMVTSGSQQAFDLVVRVLLEPGDSVLVETPTYPATLSALRLANAQVLSIPMDELGLSTDALAEMLEGLPADALPKLLYTVPNFSNPRGTLLPTERRKALVELALRYGFWIVEDDPYGELRFDTPDGQPRPMPPTIRAVAEAMSPAGGNPVIYMSSLSKTVAPGLRVGWMLAEPELQRRCTVAKQVCDLCTSPISQLIAASYLHSGRYDATVQRARQEYQRRMQALVDGLNAVPGTPIRCTIPAGGMFVWAAIDRGIDPQKLFDAAIAELVVYVPGKAFYAHDADAHTMRMSFAAPNVAQIGQATERLARAVLQARA